MIPLNIDLPKAHQLVKLSPDLYWGRLPLPFRLNHINLYIIDTKDGWVIIDAGIYGEQTSDYWRTLLDGFLSEKPIDKIIITHHHVDHIGFASELVQMTGAPCFTTDAEQAHGEFLFNLSADQMSELISSTYMRYGLHESEIEFGRRDSQRYKRYVPELPIFGICLGHQMLALALGAKTVKMNHGHHGANHPVKDLSTGKVEITSMNHGFAVDSQSLPDDVEETHISLFDGSNCGIKLIGRPVYSVQHHPEASPGPMDSFYLFERFAEDIDKKKALNL